MVLFLIMVISMKHPLKHNVIWITLFVFLVCKMHFEIRTVHALDSNIFVSDSVEKDIRQVSFFTIFVEPVNQ